MSGQRLVLLAACALAAWGASTAALLPDAVRRARLLEADDSLRRAATALPALLDAERVHVLELARAAAEQGAAEADPAEAVRRLAAWSNEPAVGWTLLTADGVVLARSDNLAKLGDSLASEPVLRQTWTGLAAERLGFVDGAWRLAAAVPVPAAPGGPRRLLLATRSVDLELAARLGDRLSVGVVLADDRLVLASTLPTASAEPFRVLLGG